MTMNKNILWMIFGATLLTGCPDEVMQQRKYVPADDPAAKSTVSDVAPDPADAPEKRQAAVEERNVDDPVRPQSPAEESKTAPRQSAEFKPMTEKFDDSGVSSDEREAAAPGEYIVCPGDTLGKIAAKHHVRLAALMKANKLTEKNAKHLRVGQKLVIPGGKASAKSGVRPSGKKASAAGKSTDGGKASIQPGEYIVKAGDTPERIARRAQIRLKELMAANNLTEDGAKRLRIGQKLVIPGKGGKTAAQPKKSAAAKKDTAKIAADSPEQTTETKPAAPAETKKEDAALLNEMQNTTVQTPAGQTADPGTAGTTADTSTAADAPRETPWIDVTEDITLVDFAKKYNTTPEALRASNPGGIGDVIKKGDTIFLPR